MQHALTCPPPSSPDLGITPSFNVVIAYEDFETGKQAKRTYDYLVENLGRDCEFSNQMWKFDVLGIPKLRDLAVADAAAADLVIVSCQGDEIPKHAKAWLDAWIHMDCKPMALVALFNVPTEAVARTRPVRDLLANAAKTAHMEFFAHPDERAAGSAPAEAFVLAARTGRMQPALSTLAGAVRNADSFLNSLD